MDVFELSAKLRLDSNVDEQLSKDSNTLSSFGSKMGKALGTAAKVGTAALGAAAGAVAFLTKQAVSSYAEQQQLEGGVKKLYGNMGMSLEDFAAQSGKSLNEARAEFYKLEGAQNMVLNNAQNAYKTAGMSANEYMETATSFSAALINSLSGDTTKAAQLTDVAMSAMSDNFNTFGGDFEGVRNAFQGFAKQNYTMLDNLKLGYGGTKSEMERLIADANAYGKATGQASDLTIDSFADVVTAIDLVQQKQGIAGTTAREAATTISGSLGMLKGAWTNLLAGLGDADADIDKLVSNVVSSAKTVLTNVMPVIETALKGISSLLSEIAPLIASELPSLVSQILPPLLSAATSLVLALVSSLPAIMQALFDAIPQIFSQIVSMDWSGIASQIMTAIAEGFNSLTGDEEGGSLLDTGLALVDKLTEGLWEGLPNLLASGGEILIDLVNSFLEQAPAFLEQGLNFIANMAMGFLDGAPQLITTIGNIVLSLIDSLLASLPSFLEKGGQFVINMAIGVMQRAPQIISSITTVLSNFISVIMRRMPEIASKGVQLIGQLAKGIIQNAPAIVSAIAGGLAQLIARIGEELPTFLQKGIELIGQIAAGLIQAIPDIVGKIPEIVSSIANEFSNYDWGSIGMNIINGVRDGVVNAAGNLLSAARDAVTNALNAAKGALKIASPSKRFRDEVGKMIGLGMALGIDDSEPAVLSSMDDLADSTLGAFDDMEFGTESVVTRVNTGNDRESDQSRIMYALETIASAITYMDESMADKMAEAVGSMRLEISGREFGRLVRDVRTA